MQYGPLGCIGVIDIEHQRKALILLLVTVMRNVYIIMHYGAIGYDIINRATGLRIIRLSSRAKEPRFDA